MSSSPNEAQEGSPKLPSTDELVQFLESSASWAASVTKGGDGNPDAVTLRQCAARMKKLAFAASASAPKPNDAAFRIKRTMHLHNSMYLCVVENADLDQLEMALDMALSQAAALRSAQAPPSADYAANNPLGGPASMFRTIASRIEAGEDYYAVLADYDLCVQPATARSDSDRDTDWILAMGHALGLNSGFEVPIVPEVEVFKRFFASLRSEMGDSDTAKVPEGYRLVREDVCEFLRGTSPLDGSWYGDLKKDLGDKRPFWWRKYLGIPFSSSGAPSPSAKRLPTVAEMKGILRDDYVPPSPDGNSREGG